VTFRLGGVEAESIVDGPGFRCTVFVQGCALGCPGCHNEALQNFAGGRTASVDDVAGAYFANPLLDGVTLSGGEPFAQAEACAALARAARQRGLGVFCYSGMTFEKLAGAGRADWLDLLGQLDVLVDGPYVAALRDLTLLWRGSSNQRLVDVPASLAAGRAVLWESAVLVC
jgi:anaerobic ribonucleoside-triphosphate reductase activating protein